MSRRQTQQRFRYCIASNFLLYSRHCHSLERNHAISLVSICISSALVILPSLPPSLTSSSELDPFPSAVRVRYGENLKTAKCKTRCNRSTLNKRSDCTGRPQNAHTWLRECCRQVEAGMVSNSRHQFTKPHESDLRAPSMPKSRWTVIYRLCTAKSLALT